MTKDEILQESINYDTIDVNAVEQPKKIVNAPSLPGECVNLMDPLQLKYYSNNKVVQQVYSYANSRRLFTAVNKPQALYACLKDDIHHGRLILPFLDANGKIVYYQSRSVEESDAPKYLSKVSSDRAIFNLNNIKSKFSDVFVFEGPIDCCFVENAIAIAGIQERSMQLFSAKQQQQINNIQGFYNLIWVLDSQWLDQASRLKTQKLIEANQNVFIWPKQLGTVCKDFNEACIRYKLDSISHTFIKQHCASGLQAQIMLSAMQNYTNL